MSELALMPPDYRYSEAIPFVKTDCWLGECPIWHKKSLLWVDILRAKVFRTNEKRETAEINMPAEVGSIGIWNERLLAATKEGFYRFDIETPLRNKLPNIPDLPERMLYNDGKIDPFGRFYVGSKHVQSKEGLGKLWRLDTNGKFTVVLDKLTIPNGMAWDENQNLMYFVDSAQKQVDVFDWNPTDGNISNRRKAFSTESLTGVPDGMCIDPQGTLWIAFWGGAKVVAFDPKTGFPVHIIHVPAPHTTSCCLGGEEKSTLFITTARKNLTDEDSSQYSLSGSVFMAIIPSKTNI